MADAIESITDAAAEVVGEINAGAGAEPEVVIGPEPQAAVEEPSESAPAEDDPVKGLSAEQLVAKLAEREKGYAELRSLHDRQMNELREKQDAINQRLVEALERQAAPAQSAEPQKSPDELYEEWGEKLMPDDPETGSRIARIVDAVGTRRFGEMQSTIEKKFGMTEQQILGLNPDYRQHKDVVDELVAGGMSFDAALGFAKKTAKGQPAAQPGTTSAPGRTDTSTRAMPAAPATPTPIRVDPTTANALRMAAETVGIKDGNKFVRDQALATAKALQAAGV